MNKPSLGLRPEINQGLDESWPEYCDRLERNLTRMTRNRDEWAAWGLECRTMFYSAVAMSLVGWLVIAFLLLDRTAPWL